MKKTNNLKFVILYLTLTVLSKTHKEQIVEISKRYLKLKKENKKRKKFNYRKVLIELIKEVPKRASSMPEVKTNHVFFDSKIIDIDIRNYLQRKFEEIDFKCQLSQKNPLKKQNVYKIVKIEKLKEDYQKMIQDFSFKNLDFMKKNDEFTTANAVHSDYFLRKMLGTIAFIIALNSFGISSAVNEKSNIHSDMIMETVDDLDYFFSNVNLYGMANALDDDSNLKYKVQVDKLLLNRSYEEQFDTILLRDDILLDEKLDLIIHSKITNYENIFQYILSKTEVPFQTAMNHIVNANITTPTNIFHFVLDMNELDMNTKMEYIIDSHIATNHEKIDFIISSDISINEKVWYSLSVPDKNFGSTFQKLLNTKSATQDEIITCIIDTDLVSYKVLFDNLAQLKHLTKDQYIRYINYYNLQSSERFNSVSTGELARYLLQVNFLTKQEQIDCIWNLLDDKSLEEKEKFILDLYQITYEDYLSIYYLKQEDMTQTHVEILSFFAKVNAEKEQYILEHYNFDFKEQLDIVVAGCAAEAINNYDDLYWVANIFFNRITNPRYVEKYGTNPYNQFIAPGQFEVHFRKTYLLYLDSREYGYVMKNALAKEAFYNRFYDGYDKIPHNYLEFRSSNTKDFSDVTVVKNGNRYGVLMKESNRIIYDNLLKEETLNGPVRKLVDD